MLSRRFGIVAVSSLLLVQAVLLAYSATRHSPTQLEPAFLASGISHWQFGRFELFRVNPPLVRIVAAIPAMALGCKTDWTRFNDEPGARAEFAVGDDLVRANGLALVPIIFYARWACIPFSLVGAYVAFRWAKELYGDLAGLCSMTLYVFEPNLLGHAELITADGACTALGVLAGYLYWRWLKSPSWHGSMLAGLALGLAILSKMTWLILFGVWPVLWLYWRSLEGHSPTNRSSRRVDVAQLLLILLVGVSAINLGYGYDGFGHRLKTFTFVSEALSGNQLHAGVGNRFANTIIGECPVPLPRQFVLGFDSQKSDFEKFNQPSFLGGEWKMGGWWYYYLYGFAVKIPCGTWGLLLLVIAMRLLSADRTASLRDEVVLLFPAAVLFVIASVQTEINQHLRYAFPSLGLMLIFIGQCGTWTWQSRLAIPSLPRLGTITLISLLLYSIASSMLAYPHQLAYFNEAAGGMRMGHRHLRGSNLDWGQDILAVLRWIDSNPDVAHCVVVTGVSFDLSAFDARLSSIAVRNFEDSVSRGLPEGYSAIPSWVDERHYDSGQSCIVSSHSLTPTMQIVKVVNRLPNELLEDYARQIGSSGHFVQR